MTSHALTLAGVVGVGLAGLALEVLGRAGRSSIPTFGALVEQAMATRSGRVGVVAAWAWIGLHFLAR